MKIIKCLIFGIFVVFFSGCVTNNSSIGTRTENIEFEQGGQFSLKIDVPENWRISRERGTPIPGTSRTYDLTISPSSREKVFLRITFGRTQDGEQLTRQKFDRLVDSRVSTLLPRAVENNATFIEVQLNNGYGKYCILTDASLVNRRNIPRNEYLYLAVYFANYSNGCIVYATLLTDDIDSASFRLMLEILSSIEVTFN